eukprot:40182-Pelagomonas_calceolata.AAC.1
MAGSAPGAPPRDLYTACTTSRMAARSMGALCRGAPASGPKGMQNFKGQEASKQASKAWPGEV